MCRFIAYIGKPILMDELVIKPKNSLIRQSIKAKEAEEPLNGDGFGIGWYDHETSEEPGLFVSVRPAWNDQNLNYLAQKIKSSCLFAHVRAANVGWVSETNCHPFHFKKFLFMHNGQVGGFPVIKRHMRRQVSDEIYDWIKGQTDSEHLFAFYLHHYGMKERAGTAAEMAEVLEMTISEVENKKKELGITEPSYINAVLTDGKRMVAVRHSSDIPEDASTLYYSEGSQYVCEEGMCRMRTADDPLDHAILVVSEKLTQSHHDWKEIPPNHLLTIDDKLKTSLRPCVI